VEVRKCFAQLADTVLDDLRVAGRAAKTMTHPFGRNELVDDVEFASVVDLVDQATNDRLSVFG
jgi:hypothetical protein